MLAFLIRRLLMALVTLVGVMLLTFVLFGLTAGDIAAGFLPPKATKQQRMEWLRRNKLHLPLIVNFHRRIVLRDRTEGPNDFTAEDAPGSAAATALCLEPDQTTGTGKARITLTLVSNGAPWLDGRTALREITGQDPWAERPAAGLPDEPDSRPAPASRPAAASPPAPAPRIVFRLHDGSQPTVDLASLAAWEEGKCVAAAGATVDDLLRLINGHPANRGRLQASISTLEPTNLFDSQFFWHFRNSLTLEGESFKHKLKLTEIIAEKARYSLALTVPILAIGWLLAMIASSIVAYYRGGLIDKAGVLLCVLGMCVPFLVYMIAGQALMLEVAPKAAWGLRPWTNIYVPILIAVAAGLGGSVRFYRTIMLNEVRQDYVRTAFAKGAPLPQVLFKHVLKNCMLPILTSLVTSVPFLILGSLMLEQFFGIPGLGSLVRTSVTDRDAPMVASITFLTAAVYIVGLLITDILYALFDPRIRLR